MAERKPDPTTEELKEAAQNPHTPPDVLESLAQSGETQCEVAMNWATPSELLHRVVTEYRMGHDDWAVDVLVGMHYGALPETLDTLVGQVEQLYGDKTVEKLADCLEDGTVTQLGGPVQVLVSVLLHRSTPNGTRERTRQHLVEASKRVNGPTRFARQLVADIRLLIVKHDGWAANNSGVEAEQWVLTWAGDE